MAYTTPEEAGLPWDWSARIVEHDDTGCWLWIGSTGINGYGVLQLNCKQTSAHRLVYEHINGKLPKNVVVDHLCRVRPCVNPDHLEAVSQSENILRGDNPDTQRRRHAERTHCKREHPLSGDNLRIATTSKGQSRVCKTCCRDWMRLRRAQAREITK